MPCALRLFIGGAGGGAPYQARRRGFNPGSRRCLENRRGPAEEGPVQSGQPGVMGAKLGQHFLIDEGVRDAIVAAAELDAGEQAVEIGPGKGILTRAILESGAKLIAVEMDGSLALALARRFSCEPRLRVIHSNFLKLDSSELGAQSVKFVANLPYAVGTPILQRILSRHLWTSAVLMFQKEVAERITAQPGGPDYGLLTLSTLLYAEAELLMEAPKTCFSPRPRA